MKVSCYDLRRGDLILAAYSPVAPYSTYQESTVPWLVSHVTTPYAGCVHVTYLNANGWDHDFTYTIERFYEVER